MASPSAVRGLARRIPEGILGARVAKAESLVLRALLCLLGRTLRKFRAQKSVVIAIDGVPPLAKLSTSQDRRIRSARSGSLSEAIASSFEATESKCEEMVASINSAAARASGCGLAEPESDGDGLERLSDCTAGEGEEATLRSSYSIRKL